MSGSLASATNTRVDSASKHIIPCKVNTDYMASLINNSVENAMMELQQNKMKYCMHKDDVVIGLGKPLYGTSMNKSSKRAYPSVIVTLAGMQKGARRFMALQNFMVRHYGDLDKSKKIFVDVLMQRHGDSAEDKRVYETIVGKNMDQRDTIIHQVNNMLEMYFAGISLGLAYAHPHSGDTVASVMIGGLRTVLNGHFQIHTNDLLCFYWDDELDLFEENGGRKDRSLFEDGDDHKTTQKFLNYIFNDKCPGITLTMTKAMKERQAFYAMGQGAYPKDPDGQGPFKGKTGVAKIKPYIVSKYPDPLTGAPQHFPMDKCRIFGKAIGNAEPFQMVDIMLSRQAI